VDAAREVAPRKAGIGGVVAQRLAELEGFFRRSLLADQADGSIGCACATRGLARVFPTAVTALRVLARARPDPVLAAARIRANPARSLVRFQRMGEKELLSGGAPFEGGQPSMPIIDGGGRAGSRQCGLRPRLQRLRH
jgi:hypothetical protein